MQNTRFILDSAIFYSNDILKVRKFYKEIIGFKTEYQNGNKYISFIFKNKARLGIKKAIEKREQPGHQTISVEVDDLNEYYKEIKAN